MRLPRVMRMRRGAGLVCLALAVVSGAARGQDAPPSSAPLLQSPALNVQDLPPGTILPPGTVRAPAPAPPGGFPPPAGAPLAEPFDYWIVSSRRCKGKPAAANAGCLQFFHRSSERDLRELGRDAFFSSIRPDQPVCFVVHGSYNWWRDVVNESKKINRWIRSADPAAPVQVVFFTWPSDGNMPFLFPVDIAVLGRKASQHSIYLATVISQLPPDQPVSILGHSHGARSAVAALHLLGGGMVEGQALPPGYSTPRHLRAVLIAAAVDHNWLNPGDRYGQALLVPEQILLMRNSRDTTLAVYPLRFGKGQRAMGREGIGTQNRLAMDQMGKKIVELDASQFAGPHHSFADYHEHSELASSIVPYVHFHEDGSAPSSYESARPIAPPSRTPELGDPEPINPGQRESTDRPAPGNGPKLAPASVLPISGDSWLPVPEEHNPDPGEIVKIYPKKPPASDKARTESVPASVKRTNSPKAKTPNRFELRIEP